MYMPSHDNILELDKLEADINSISDLRIKTKETEIIEIKN